MNCAISIRSLTKLTSTKAPVTAIRPLRLSTRLLTTKMSELPKHLQESKDRSKCEYRRLGDSGLRVSVPIFGAMSLGTPDWAPWVMDEAKSVELLKAAYDRGLNTWDTANSYANGASEQVIAKCLKQHKIPRHKVVILTKLYFGVAEEMNVNVFQYKTKMQDLSDYVNTSGLSRNAIYNQVNESLKRLETDYIDLLQIHRFDYNTPIEETMKALHDLVESGKVRYIGASSMWAYQLAMMQACAEKHGWTKFVSMQNQYNMLYREEEREMIKFCKATGVGLIPWAPLCRGHLARPLSSYGETVRSSGEKKTGTSATGPSIEADRKIIERVEEIAKKKNWTMSDVALAWINKRVTSPIIGFSKVERIDEALSGVGKELTEDEEKYLEELYQPKNVLGHA